MEQPEEALPFPALLHRGYPFETVLEQLSFIRQLMGQRKPAHHRFYKVNSMHEFGLGLGEKTIFRHRIKFKTRRLPDRLLTSCCIDRTGRQKDRLMAEENEIPSLYAASIGDWREWLTENCETEKVVFLIVYHKSSKVPCIRWHDAIEHALCFGWVDSKAKRRDAQSTYLKFTPRNPKSKWGRGNIERAKRMIDQGFMTRNSQKLIDIAKSKGNWKED